ncbi:hypothetical protein THAOC_36648 [Thalassiosira oceanica]|uniref:Uncharacterized protein n=1 Tax=Thalassiosira oceanica TaxID=159749 RepID=K0QZV1_THAOC|nr:hypothetical protein THAOC_36648 [Thalassiosira oceanica]|eukprot:EJK44785.1 hypothetical protein THAOC_36648 [Thalassiosira oceanica]
MVGRPTIHHRGNTDEENKQSPGRTRRRRISRIRWKPVGQRDDSTGTHSIPSPPRCTPRAPHRNRSAHDDARAQIFPALCSSARRTSAAPPSSRRARQGPLLPRPDRYVMLPLTIGGLERSPGSAKGCEGPSPQTESAWMELVIHPVDVHPMYELTERRSFHGVVEALTNLGRRRQHQILRSVAVTL